MKPHKHAELIKAWADGAIVQYRDDFGDWEDWDFRNAPPWFEDHEYRIKPEPKPEPVKQFMYIYNNPMDGKTWIEAISPEDKPIARGWNYMGRIEVTK